MLAYADGNRPVSPGLTLVHHGVRQQAMQRENVLVPDDFLLRMLFYVAQSGEVVQDLPLRTRFQRDVGELESYFENYARRYAETTVMMLRYQPTLGSDVDSPLTRLLRQPVVPTQLGYDPLLQFVHGNDAVGALEAAVRRPVRGPVNVAGEGSISLVRLLRLAGKLPAPVPAPLFGTALSAGRRLGVPRLPEDAVRWLRHGLTIDCSRLIEEVGYRPRSTEETVHDFLHGLQGRRVLPGPRDSGLGAPQITPIATGALRQTRTGSAS